MKGYRSKKLKFKGNKSWALRKNDRYNNTPATRIYITHIAAPLCPTLNYQLNRSI